MRVNADILAVATPLRLFYRKMSQRLYNYQEKCYYKK